MKRIKVHLDIGRDAIRDIVYTALEDSPGIDITDGAYPDSMTFSDAYDESMIITILDIGQDADNWFDTVRRIKEDSPSVAVLLVADDDDDDLRYDVLQSGADAFLLIDRTLEKLIKTIDELSYGYLPVIRILLRPSIASSALDEFHGYSVKNNEEQRPHIRLSFQERTLLQYIENRHSVPQLISNLGISQSVIVEQLESIREKLVEIFDFSRPAPQPALVPVAEMKPEVIKEEMKEPPKALKTAGKLPSGLKQLPFNKITPLLAAYPQKLYKGIFRPTVSKVIILFIVMIIGFFLSIHLLPGHNMYVVSSESMSPTINIGDIIVTRSLDEQSKGSLTAGDIITFDHGRNTVTHRLLSVNGTQLTTKGDAAEESDPWTITLSEVKDVYLFRIPLLGYIPQLAKEKIGWFLIIVLPAMLLVALLVKDIIKEALKNDKPATETQGGGVICKS